MKLTQEFIRHTYHRDDLYLDEVDRRFVEEFEFYLKTHRGWPRRATSSSAAASRGSPFGHQAARTRAHRHRHAGPPLDPQAAPEDRQHVQHPAAGDPRADSAARPHGSRVRGAQRAVARVEQPEDERLPEGAGRHLRYPQAADDPYS